MTIHLSIDLPVSDERTYIPTYIHTSRLVQDHASCQPKADMSADQDFTNVHAEEAYVEASLQTPLHTGFERNVWVRDFVWSTCAVRRNPTSPSTEPCCLTHNEQPRARNPKPKSLKHYSPTPWQAVKPRCATDSQKGPLSDPKEPREQMQCRFRLGPSALNNSFTRFGRTRLGPWDRPWFSVKCGGRKLLKDSHEGCLKVYTSFLQGLQ